MLCIVQATPIAKPRQTGQKKVDKTGHIYDIKNENSQPQYNSFELLRSLKKRKLSPLLQNAGERGFWMILAGACWSWSVYTLFEVRNALNPLTCFCRLDVPASGTSEVGWKVNFSEVSGSLFASQLHFI